MTAARSAGMVAFAALTVVASSVIGLTGAGAADVADILYYCSSCHGPDGRKTPTA